MTNKQNGSAISRFRWFLLKLGIAFGVVFYLIASRYGELMRCFRSFDYRWLLPAMFFYGCHMVVCAWRWRRLANILGIELSRMKALSLTMQGYFFSLVIPGGAIGGDVVKMGVLSRCTVSGEKIEGAFTVLMDRIIGMIALFVLALVLLCFASGLLQKVPVFSSSCEPGNAGTVLVWLVAALCLSGLAASCVIFFHRLLEKVPLFGKLMRWGDRKTGGLVSRLTSATDTYAGQWKELTLLVIVSIFFVHIMTAVPMFFLLAGSGCGFSIFTVIVALTIGNIAGLIPLFPGGIGGRDITVIAILLAGAVPRSDAETAQLLYTGIILFFNLCGALFFLFDPGRRAKQKELSHE